MDIAQIVSMAKEKIGSTSLSDRTISEYFNAVNPQAEPDDAFWLQHTSVLKSMSGQFSHDVAAWQQQYAKEHPSPEPSPSPAPAPGIDPVVQQILDGYKQQMDEMRQLISEQQQQHTDEQYRSGAVGRGKELNVVYDKLWNDAVSRTPIVKGMTQESFESAVKSTYEKTLQYFGDGVQGYGVANPANPGAKTKATLDAFFAKKGLGQNNNK